MLRRVFQFILAAMGMAWVYRKQRHPKGAASREEMALGPVAATYRPSPAIPAQNPCQATVPSPATAVTTPQKVYNQGRLPLPSRAAYTHGSGSSAPVVRLAGTVQRPWQRGPANAINIRHAESAVVNDSGHLGSVNTLPVYEYPPSYERKGMEGAEDV